MDSFAGQRPSAATPSSSQAEPEQRKRPSLKAKKNAWRKKKHEDPSLIAVIAVRTPKIVNCLEKKQTKKHFGSQNPTFDPTQELPKPFSSKDRPYCAAAFPAQLRMGLTNERDERLGPCSIRRPVCPIAFGEISFLIRNVMVIEHCRHDDGDPSIPPRA